MRLRPDILVVFEGPDGTGKSTQADAVARLFPDDVMVHSPSGGGPLGDAIYVMTEAASEGLQPLTRQFLHLAAHCEMYAHTVLPALASGRGVFMDRNWWSTLAYLDADHPTILHSMKNALADVVLWPTQGRMPDVVFLFMEEHVRDSHNTRALRRRYQGLAREYYSHTFMVPDWSPHEVTAFIVEVLDHMGLVDPPGYA